MRDRETVQERKQAGHAPTNVSLGAAADTMTRTRANAHSRARVRLQQICDTIGAADQQWKDSSSLVIHISGVNLIYYYLSHLLLSCY